MNKRYFGGGCDSMKLERVNYNWEEEEEGDRAERKSEMFVPPVAFAFPRDLLTFTVWESILFFHYSDRIEIFQLLAVYIVNSI